MNNITFSEEVNRNQEDLVHCLCGGQFLVEDDMNPLRKYCDKCCTPFDIVPKIACNACDYSGQDYFCNLCRTPRSTGLPDRIQVPAIKITRMNRWVMERYGAPMDAQS